MADITTTEYFPDVGQLWARVVALWEYYVQNTTSSWIVYYSAVSSCRAATVIWTEGGDDLYHQLLDISLAGSGKRRVDDIISAPGFSTAPKTLLTSYGSHSPGTDWAGTLWFARNKIIENWSNAEQLLDNQQSWTLAPMSGTSYIRTSVWRERNVALADTSTLTTWDGASGAEIAGGQNPAFPGKTPSVPVIGGGGGGSVDLAPVVEALQDIALRDVDYQANNGSTVFTMRGRVNVG